MVNGTDYQIDYTYDPDGIRTSKVVTNVDSLGETTYNYITMGGKVARQTWGSNVMDFIYDADGQPHAMVYNGTLYYYILNLQGDVIRIITSTGTTVAEYQYDVWGKPTVISGTTVANANPLRYRGYYYDTETGFYYVSSRYYDPAIGRFINADDPSYLAANGDFISYNLYAYCGNNPVTRTDINGNAWHLAIGAAIGIGTQLLSDVLTGSTSSLSDYAIAAVGGALAASSISTIGSVIANGALGGAAYLANCESQGTTANSLDFILAVGIGAVSGAIGGSGANGTKLKGVYKTSRVMLDSVVSQTKQAMYTAKIKQVTNTIVESVTRTVIAGVSSNYLNIGRRNVTDSLI